jgi:hypothetical protein
LRMSVDASWLIRATLRDIKQLSLDSEGVCLRDLYVFAWRRIHSGSDQDQLAFTSVDRGPLNLDELKDYLRLITGVRRTAEFNGLVCRSLLIARKGNFPVPENIV